MSVRKTDARGAPSAGATASDAEALTARTRNILRECEPLMQVLRTARALALPDWMVFSGAVYQPVLNHLTGRDSGARGP